MRAATESAGPGALPAASYAASRDAIRAEIARVGADPTIAPTAVPRFYEHGAAVDRAVILFHGFTNCPQQFDELARDLAAKGCNVYVPLIPRHGKRDRLTWDLGDLTVAELQACARDAFVAARGLGRHVSALGLSLGGTMALYLGQTQPVDLAIPVSPFLMPIGVPRRPGLLAMRVLDFIPDMYWWWDPRVKAGCKPDYAYPGFPSHSLATIVFLGGDVYAASNVKPAASRCILVTNANESAVNNNVTRELFTQIQKSGGATDEVVLHGLGAPRHDIIDPTTFPQARTLVYPKLEELILSA